MSDSVLETLDCGIRLKTLSLRPFYTFLLVMIQAGDVEGRGGRRKATTITKSRRKSKNDNNNNNNSKNNKNSYK